MTSPLGTPKERSLSPEIEQPTRRRWLPTRRALLVVGGAAALVLAGGTAYATIPRHAPQSFDGCVNLRTGALRMIDMSYGQSCNSHRGPAQEKAISWGQGEPGPAGPPGPRGPAGSSERHGSDTSSRGDEALTNLDQLAGLPCNTDTPNAGVIEIHIAPPGSGSYVTMICKTHSTVDLFGPTVAPPTVAPPTDVEPGAQGPGGVGEGHPDPTSTRTVPTSRVSIPSSSVSPVTAPPTGVPPAPAP